MRSVIPPVSPARGGTSRRLLSMTMAASSMKRDSNSPVDPREYRRALGLFASGITVIATQIGDEIHAMTANAVSALSLDPALVLFCPAKHSKFAANLAGVHGFSINFLREDQQSLASYFAGAWREASCLASTPPFRFVPACHAPRLEGSLASLDCCKHAVINGGDHWIVVGRAVSVHQGIEPHRPLLFFKGQFRDLNETVGAPAPDLATVQDEPAHIFYER